ncbi:MAG: tRNA 2-thiouridine(34) synthase MnmA [Planctomycetota bacterium]|nr:MAG: tRNA 2-thiouridine(34) synthase MnmA [Planctomycetota bacterium]
MARVVLAMSGGVDSSVAAHLLCEAGHEVIGVFMRHGVASPLATAAASCTSEPGGSDNGGGGGAGNVSLPIVSTRLDHKQGCCSAADAEDGRRVADRLGIPFYALNLEEEFARIIDYFVDEYTAARTPNPCVMCNNWIKFGKLFDYADSVGADFVATGHYAQLEPAQESDRSGTPRLVRGIDVDKDQSYVLFGIERARLARMLLPVGGFRKPEIRARAAELGLRVADKRDSQEICFVTSGKHDEFVRGRRDSEIDTAGEIVTTDGTVVGEHPGIEGFTIGQRRGLGVALGDPRFVVRIEHDTRRVVIGEREDLARTDLTASECNWLGDVPIGPRPCLAQIRYNSSAQPAVMERLNDGRLSVQFDAPCHGVAPGQAVVCYDGEQVLGGGWIE